MGEAQRDGLPNSHEVGSGRSAAIWSAQLTGSRHGFLFSVPLQVKGLGQVQGRFVEWQLVHSRPKIQDVALGAALGLEALEDVLTQVRREGWLRVGRLAVDRARAAALQAAAA